MQLFNLTKMKKINFKPCSVNFEIPLLSFKGSAPVEEEVSFNWLPIVELLQEKGDNYFDRHKKVDCSVQNLCKTLSTILGDKNTTQKEQNCGANNQKKNSIR